MTGAEFARARHTLGLTWSCYADLLALSEPTVYRWASLPRRPIPATTALLLDLILAGLVPLAAVQERRTHVSTPTAARRTG